MTVPVTDVGTHETVNCPSVTWPETFDLELKKGSLQGKGNKDKVVNVVNP
jgi:hypothetical protein